jgi:K+-sensing histidine kinase KdpD
MQAALEQDASLPANSDMSSAVAHGVRAPLAALRASMESLVHRFNSSDPRSLAVRGALDEVVRLGHEMQTLLDYALPLPLQSLSCSLREIVCSAVDGLCPRRRSDVWVAIEDRRTRLQVDGALLSRSLARLIESASAVAQGPVLLRARTDGPDAVFSVVHGEPSPPRSGETAMSTTTATSVLGLVLARRDVERMGGRFCFRRGDDGRIVSEIRLPGSSDRQAA